jgi:23S rRNA (cytidine1920-2'-O)/16S rRNA (cytidine1409-2'-O)-methyltransferase
VTTGDTRGRRRVCHDTGVRSPDRSVTARPRPAHARPGGSSAGKPRPSRVRLDQLLVERGLAGSRSRAQALILGGRVRVGEGDAARGDRKPGDQVDPAVPVRVLEPEPYVSRGGHKLAAALDAFGIDPAGLVALDAGASTGGFTDVLLQRGAARVYAVDVGRGQLAERVRTDPRVVVMDRTNARSLGPSSLPEPVDLAVVDVSFISLELVLGPIAACLGPAGRVVPLVKPQFEVGRGQARGGVVRDPALHLAALQRAVRAAASAGLGVAGAVSSPLLGPEGNREFLLDLRRGRPDVADLAERLTAATR